MADDPKKPVIGGQTFQPRPGGPRLGAFSGSQQPAAQAVKPFVPEDEPKLRVTREDLDKLKANLEKAKAFFAQGNVAEAGPLFRQSLGLMAATLKGPDGKIDESTLSDVRDVEYEVLLMSARFSERSSEFKSASECYKLLIRAFISKYKEAVPSSQGIDTPWGKIDITFSEIKMGTMKVPEFLCSKAMKDSPNFFIEAARLFGKSGEKECMDACWNLGALWLKSVAPSALDSATTANEELKERYGRLLKEAGTETSNRQTQDLYVSYAMNSHTNPKSMYGGFTKAVDALLEWGREAEVSEVLEKGINSRVEELAKAKREGDSVHVEGLLERLKTLYKYSMLYNVDETVRKTAHDALVKENALPAEETSKPAGIEKQAAAPSQVASRVLPNRAVGAAIPGSVEQAAAEAMAAMGNLVNALVGEVQSLRAEIAELRKGNKG